MFLATTAIEEFWDTSQKILFLGEWCKIYNRKDCWSRLDTQTAPYHWKDRQKLYDDYKYIDEIYEKYLKSLSEILNSIHNVDHSLRYWRIVVGWWLRYFLEVLYDRYRSICSAADSYPIDNTWIISDTYNHHFIPEDFTEFSGFVSRDKYSLFLYSRIIEHVGNVSFNYKTIEIEKRHVKRHFLDRKSKLGIKKGLKNFIQMSRNYVPFSLRQVEFFGTHFSPKNLLKLQLILKQYPALEAIYPNLDLSRVGLDLKLRKGIGISKGQDQFCEYLDRNLFLNIPKSYFEAYSSFRETLKKFSKNPKIIFTSTAHLTNDVFKLWVADCVEKGSKFLIGQHGGFYGTGMYSSEFDHSLKIAETFFTWGCGQKEVYNLRQAPAPKLIHIKKLGKKITNNTVQQESKMYLNLTSYPRYAYYLYSVPFSSFMLEYIDFIINFINTLRAEIQNKLVCRPFMKDYGWNEIDRIKEKNGDVKFDLNWKPWQHVIPKASFVIETANQTTFLESLSANVPTILLIQEEYWEANHVAKKDIEKLKKVGIVYNDWQKAANQVNMIYNEPGVWWSQKDIQNAKNEFCDNYAFTSKRWLRMWGENLSHHA